jgi:hypothetical protein
MVDSTFETNKNCPFSGNEALYKQVRQALDSKAVQDLFGVDFTNFLKSAPLQSVSAFSE